MAQARSAVAGLEDDLDSQRLLLSGAELEAANAAIIRLKDVDLGHRAPTGCGPPARSPTWPGPTRATPPSRPTASIQVALSALDRLEVRGRDSAGIHLLVDGHGLDPTTPPSPPRWRDRVADPAVHSLVPVRAAERPRSAFVYKAAAEIGELGDNVRALRAAITADDLLRRALAADDAEAMVAGPHPLGQRRHHQRGQRPSPQPRRRPARRRGPTSPPPSTATSTTTSSCAPRAACHPAEITTDAKVIPMLVVPAHRRGPRPGRGVPPAPWPPSRVRSPSPPARPTTPDRLLLALRGSGQALYVGLAEDAYVVASEPYGVVEETARYLRMDGESRPGPGRGPGRRARPRRGRHRRAASSRLTYDGARAARRPTTSWSPPRSPPATSTGAASRTSCSRRSPRRPQSFRKTLRGKLVGAGRPAARSSSARRRSPPTVREAWPAARSGGCSSSARARPRSPARRWPPP